MIEDSSKIGNNVTSTKSFIGHDTVIGDNVVIHPNVTIGEGVTIGEEQLFIPMQLLREFCVIGKMCDSM